MIRAAAHIASGPGAGLAAGLAVALAGCAQTPTAPDPVTRAAQPFTPVYQGVETALLDGDLVQFDVAMSGARDGQDVTGYAECAAAQYALIRGYGFARLVRTKVKQSGKVWTADAVYVISAALPQGLKTIDAEVTVAACKENGIPTV